MRARCDEGRANTACGELTVRLVVTVGDHPSVGLTVASVLLAVEGELQAACAPVREVELSLEGLASGPGLRT